MVVAEQTPSPVSYAPFLKWAGGKGQLLRQFEAFFPARAAGYYEPFVGSGAVFFHLKNRAEPFAASYHVYDANPELINVFLAVRDDLDALIEELAVHRDQHDKAYYYAVRERDRQPAWAEVDPVTRAARMIYLNKTCYNGLWRVNQQGHFNVPMGRYKKPAILDEPRLRAASEALQGVEIAARDFREATADAQAGDFVYFDPPYDPISKTANFTEYSADNFGVQDQRDLADLYRDLDARGCQLMLSNSDTPLVRELYADFRIETVQARRLINSKARRRGPITEVVVLNYVPQRAQREEEHTE